jgi:hypothetical protein
MGGQTPPVFIPRDQYSMTRVFRMTQNMIILLIHYPKVVPFIIHPDISCNQDGFLYANAK